MNSRRSSRISNILGCEVIPTDFELTAECLACILRQVLEASEEASKDVRLRYQAVRDAVIYLNTASSQEWDHVRVASELHRIVRRATGNLDPYHELKKMPNPSWLEECYLGLATGPSILFGLAMYLTERVISHMYSLFFRSHEGHRRMLGLRRE